MKRFVFSIGVACSLAVLAVTGVFAIGMSVPSAQIPEAPASVTADYTTVINEAMVFLSAQQLPDGSFDGDEFTTIKVVFATAAAGRSSASMTSISGHTPLDFLVTRAITYTHNGNPAGPLNAGRAGMVAAAAVAASADPRNFGGMDLVQALTGVYSPTTGAYGAGGTGNQWWAIVGLAAAQAPVPILATDYLISLQLPDGGWGWGTLSDADTTAAVIQALLASGNVTPTHPIIEEALTFLRDIQMSSGGWGYEDWVTGDPVLSSDSTAAVIQALAAVGYVPATESWATPGGNPHAALLSFRQPNGSFGASASATLATAHAVAGLAEAPLPTLGRAQRANRALTWVQEQQFDDGSWGTAGQTLDAMLAFAAAGYDPATVTSQGNSPLDYLETEVFTYTHDDAGMAAVAQTGKTILGLVAAGQDPYAFGAYPPRHTLVGQPLNLVWDLLSTYHAETGAFSTTVTYAQWQAWAMLGLRAAENPVPQQATDFLLSLQEADGGWGWGYGSDVDSTGLVLQALMAVGVPIDHTAIVSATLYLKQEQDAQGSWGYVDWVTSNYVPSANTTAYAMQGLLAAEEGLIADWSTATGRSPYEALAGFQRADGPFIFDGSDNLLATAQAVPAMLGTSYPLYPQRTIPSDEYNRAGLVIDYADAGDLRLAETVCVTFTEAQISGMDLLDRSGIPYGETGGFLDHIRGVGAPQSGTTHYWSYWWRDPVSETWQAYMIGAGDAVITDGSVDGWHWVDWNIWPSPEPRLNLSFEKLCGTPSFKPFVSVYRGADPDRLVTATPRVARNGNVMVTLPFGSDLNGDGLALVAWRVAESGGDWLPAPAATRHDGYFIVAFPASSLTLLQDYEFRVIFSDPDGVQHASQRTVTLKTQARLYLPLVMQTYRP